ncbi:hypothetical protein [Sphingosinicella rhizophila]|uniref:Secreted protein n=1 Tax=Sphingosinicella rhizophila TaxID=3050082 RepID=A0ABU3Q9G4_9SPHN|nr:hypothetical protein [Sphingosinicella sp. GR2756]MDT9600050.1 hypothetical protein [Sphingosinicella sp. GR2756]
MAAGAAIAVTFCLFAVTLSLLGEAVDDSPEDRAGGLAHGDLPSLPAGFLPAGAAAPFQVVSVPRTARKAAR